MAPSFFNVLFLLLVSTLSYFYLYDVGISMRDLLIGKFQEIVLNLSIIASSWSYLLFAIEIAWFVTKALGPLTFVFLFYENYKQYFRTQVSLSKVETFRLQQFDQDVYTRLFFYSFMWFVNIYNVFLLVSHLFFNIYLVSGANGLAEVFWEAIGFWNDVIKENNDPSCLDNLLGLTQDTSGRSSTTYFGTEYASYTVHLLIILIHFLSWRALEASIAASVELSSGLKDEKLLKPVNLESEQDVRRNVVDYKAGATISRKVRQKCIV
jgi:hypothetical protein